MPFSCDVPNLSHEECFAVAGTSVSSRFSVNSSKHSGRSRNRCPDAPSLSLFLFLFWIIGFVSRQLPVEDELVPEFDDNPVTARGT